MREHVPSKSFGGGKRRSRDVRGKLVYRSLNATRAPNNPPRVGASKPLWMWDRTLDAGIYFELDVIGNVRRLRGGARYGSGGPPPLPSDLGGYKYTAFGKTLAADAGTPAPMADGSPFEEPLRWQGRWYSALAGGVYDVRNRQWSPELGVFLSPDDFVFLSRTGTLWSWPAQSPLGWRDPSGRTGAFVWGSAGGEAGTGVRVGAEGIGLGGYDTKSGFYAGVIGAAGMEVGGESNYVGGFGGLEKTTAGPAEKIALGEVGLGVEIPFLAGAGLVLGGYRTGSGEWGLFGGGREGIFGAHKAGGLGVSLPTSVSSWLDSHLLPKRAPPGTAAPVPGMSPAAPPPPCP